MRLVLLILPFLAVTALYAGNFNELKIVPSDSATNYKIYVDMNAAPAEKTAAFELQKYIFEITNVKIPVIRTLADDAGEIIYVGDSKALRKLAADTVPQKLEGDQIIMKTIRKNLILLGAAPRGTLYAVYTFLEDFLGVRWWTSTESTVPRSTSITLKQINYAYTPPVKLREVHFPDVFTNAEFAVKMKNNGNWPKIPEKLGGNNGFVKDFCHTFFKLLPPGKNFQKHPEWYSMVDGKRISHGQLCLSNPEVAEMVTENVLEWLRKSQYPRFISISQMDNQLYCRCPACNKIMAEEKSQSGVLIRFINQVAKNIEKEFPKVTVSTLAYQYTRKPPSKVRPLANVMIRLCSIECDFSKKMTDKANRNFANDIKKWSQIATKLAIWNYVTNFKAYLAVHPNWDALADDIRFFVNHKAVSIYEQGNGREGNLGDMLPLRGWLMSKLLWDPSLNQNKLVDTFMHGYYLQAAAEMKKYYELSVRTGKNSTVKIGCGQESTSEWLPLDILFKMRGHLLYALKAAGQNQILIRRISRELVVVNFSILTRALEVSRSKVWKSKVDLKKLYEDTIREADRQGIIGTREGFTTTTELYARLKVMVYGKNNPVHPGMIDGIKNEELLIIPARDFIKRGETSLVKDADAINGAAVQLAKVKNDWSIQVFLPFLPVCKSWEIWAAVKMPYNKNTALTYGYYSYKHRNFKQIEKEIMVNQTKKSGYQLVFLNQLDLSEGNYQVFLGLKNKISSACFIDYFVLKPINNTSK